MFFDPSFSQIFTTLHPNLGKVVRGRGRKMPLFWLLCLFIFIMIFFFRVFRLRFGNFWRMLIKPWIFLKKLQKETLKDGR